MSLYENFHTSTYITCAGGGISSSAKFFMACYDDIGLICRRYE